MLNELLRGVTRMDLENPSSLSVVSNSPYHPSSACLACLHRRIAELTIRFIRSNSGRMLVLLIQPESDEASDRFDWI
jgi:hypothetical protein